MKRFLLWLLLFILMGCSSSHSTRTSHMIGRDTSWLSLQLDSKSAPLTAFTTALVQEISQLTGYPFEIVNIDPIQLFQSLEEKEVGGILSPLTPGLLSKKKYSFSDPIVELGPVLIVRSGFKSTSLLDLSKKIVAVYQYDESILVAQDYPSIILQFYQNMPNILEDLKKGTVDAVLMPVLEARSLVNKLYPGQLQIVSNPLNQKAIRLITCKSYPRTMMRNFNKGLQKIRESGSYEKLRRIYHLD